MKRAVVLILGLVPCTAGLVTAGPIHEAIESGDLARVKAILAQNPGQVNEKDARNNTLLHLAATGAVRQSSMLSGLSNPCFIVGTMSYQRSNEVEMKKQQMENSR